MNNENAIYCLLTSAITNKATPGISYSINSPLININNFLGFTTYTKQKRITPDLIYDIASLTKVIGITSRILQLLGHKKLTLDDPINKYIKNTKYSNIKIKNLLLHNSGLPADLKDVMSYKTKEAVISAIKETPLIYPTGKNMVYSDLNFVLLGLIIEKIDNMPLNKSIKKFIIDPMKLTKTGYLLKFPKNQFVPTEQNKNRGLIQGKVHDETAHKLNGVSGNAGLFSTLFDLNKICEMYLSFGNYKDKEIIPKSAIEMLFNYNFYGRTLGWKRWSTTKKQIWHTGFTGTSIALDFDKKSSFVCLTNRICPSRQNKQWINIRRLAIGLFFNNPEILPNN